MHPARLLTPLFVLLLLAAGAAAAPKNAELIVGKWDIGMETVMEYRKDGTLSMVIGKIVVNGRYKFINDDTMEVEITLGDQTKKNQLKVSIKDDELTTTEANGKSNKLKRIK